MPCVTVNVEGGEEQEDGSGDNGSVTLSDNPVEWAKQNPMKAGAGAIVAMNFLGN